MSKVDDLINEYCPDGVEFKTLGEIAKIKHGQDYKTLSSGNIPVYGSGGIVAYVDTYAYDKPTVLIPRKGTITNLFYLEEPFWNIDTVYYTVVDTTQIVPKYFYHFMKTVDLLALDTGSGRPSLTMNILNRIKIAIPSLPIQEEIVNILDKFTELEAELEARQQQYSYYRNQLFTFGDSEVEWKSLEEVSEIYDSLHQTPRYSENGLSMVRVTDIKGGMVNTNKTLKVNKKVFETFTRKYLPKKFDIVMSRVGHPSN